MSDKSNCIRVVICWAFSLLCRDFKSSLCSPDIDQSMMSVENVPDDAESQCSVSAETESVSSIERESTSLPEDCHEDTDSLCSQNDSDKGEGSDRWNWAEHFFAGHSQFDLEEPEVNYESASCDGNVDTDADERIFPGCPLTLNLSAVLIMEFLVHHKISQKAAEDIVELLTAHFPPGHKMLTSLYRLKSHWRKQSAMSK